MAAAARASGVRTVTDSGTSCRRSERRSAVTMTSLSSLTGFCNSVGAAELPAVS